MTLQELMQGVSLSAPLPDALAPLNVSHLTYDSRKVGDGTLFFAFAGAKADGREFAASAMAAGALAVVSELPEPEGFAGPWLRVHHGRQALATVSANFYDHPDRKLHIVGITGTNGKTTTAYLLDAIWAAAGLTTALVGTVEYRLAGETLPSVNTTPESLDLFALFQKLVDRNGTHVTMETSSHALALGRVYGVQFETGVFLNLTRDHLDFHGTMDNYFQAKQLLFTPEGAIAPKFAIVNRDDRYARTLDFQPETQVIWFGSSEGSNASAQKVTSTFDGLRFDIRFEDRAYPIESSLVGDVNVSNILAAWCVAHANGVAPEVIAQGIKQCGGVPGRFERVRAGQPFLVAVDYAHTDDALRNTISMARKLTTKRVITLFGCGGDRDRSKRPLMGMAAAELSDHVVLTSDNPRSEDPLSIMNDAMVGLRRFDTPLIVEPDRERAISKAIELAGPGDIVILAGKGHENYQVLRDKTIHFDDREVAAAVLKRFGYKG